MIYIDRTIIIANNEATIEQPIVLYKGDKNVQLLFTLKDNYLKYKSMENAYGQLIIKRETASPIFSEEARLSSSKVTFVVTKEMIDEMVELGNYDFQIRLFSQDKSSRATLPPISKGIIIKEPILQEEIEEINEVGTATVNNVEVAEGYTELEVFDEEGNYNKTTWHNGDIITDVKLNKIEEAIYEINTKEGNGTVDLNGYATIEQLETKADKDHTHEEYLTEHQDISHLATKEEIPSLDGYATETYVTNAIAQAELGGEDSGIDLSGYATKDDLVTKADKEHTHNEFNMKADKEHTHEEYATINNPTFTGNISMNRLSDTTVGNYSVALGHNATASGFCSFSVGSNTVASGQQSIALGCHTIASGQNQLVHGYCNIEDTTGYKYAHIVGNGEGTGKESNAYTLDWNGNGWYQGKLTVGVEPTEDMDLTTKSYVDTAIANIDIPQTDLSDYALKTDLDDYATKEHTHEEYLTEHQDISHLALKTEIPTDYLTEIPTEYITETELNNKGYLTQHQDISHLALKTELFSKDYNDLTNKPTIPSVEGLASEEYVDNAIANIEMEDTLVTVTATTLTTDKYQYITINGDTEIVLPITNGKFKEIHLFFDLGSNFANTITLISENNSQIRYQAEMTFEADNGYELVATYVPNMYWLVGLVKYEGACSSGGSGEITPPNVVE